jgi:hypothetical protein
VYRLEPIDQAMIWLFDRAHEALSLETAYDNISGQYLVTLRQPDGNCVVERFPNAETLEQRLAALETGLEADRWQRRAGKKRNR